MMHREFKRQYQIRFRDCDPAGIAFFGNIFSFAHDTFEEFLPAAGIPWKDWFQSQNFIVPIRHTECDFQIPFVPGSTYEIVSTISRLGESSFTMKYRFIKDGKTNAVVQMTHVFLKASTKEKMMIPENLKKQLSVFAEVQS